MSFLSVWIIGYYHPVNSIEHLRDKPAPQWGFFGALLRAVFDSLLIYLPMTLLGRSPSTPSNLSFLSTENYYLASIFFMPVYLLLSWLMLSALAFVIIRLSGYTCRFDQILNITGMSALVVGSFLIFWDWLWILCGWHSAVLLGISHLVIVIWGIILTTVGFQRILGLRLRFAILLNIVWIAAGLPLAMIFARAPV